MLIRIGVAKLVLLAFLAVLLVTSWVSPGSAALDESAQQAPIESEVRPVLVATRLTDIPPQLTDRMNVVLQRFPGVIEVYGFGTRPSHSTGWALDFMVGRNNTLGDRIAEYLITRSDVQYVMWYRRIWNAACPGWRDVPDRGNDTANHIDHPHVTYRYADAPASDRSCS